MTNRRGPNWDNHIMRKHGQSIREKIAEAFAPYARAVVLARIAKLMDRQLDAVDDHDATTH